MPLRVVAPTMVGNTPMRALTLLLGFSLTAGGGSSNANPQTPDARLATAEAFIDAFYSFDQTRLHPAMAEAPASMGDTLYYQQWAEAGHYVVLKRKPCRLENADQV